MNQDALHAIAVLRAQHECTYTSVCIGCQAIDVLLGAIANVHDIGEEGRNCEVSADRLQRAEGLLSATHAGIKGVLGTFYGKSRPR